MPINPWYTTQRLPIWTIALTTDAGNAVNLTNVDSSQISVMLKNLSNQQERMATGTLQVLIPATNGVITLALSQADVAAAGLYEVTVWVAFAVGQSEAYRVGIWDVATR